MGLIGLVITIVLLAWPTRAAAKEAEVANAIAGATDLFTCTAGLREMLRLFVRQPELRAYFYDDAPCPTDQPQRACVIWTAEILGDALEDPAAWPTHPFTHLNQRERMVADENLRATTSRGIRYL